MIETRKMLVDWTVTDTGAADGAPRDHEFANRAVNDALVRLEAGAWNVSIRRNERVLAADE